MKIYRRYKQKNLSNRSGFTIIESLVAIIVAGILMTAIAPTIVLSVATRVQARRVELAVDASKSYIDGVRTNTIDVSNLPSNSEVKSYNAPQQGTLTCTTANDYCTSPQTNLYCIDGDADGNCSSTNSRDMIVQAFRYNKNSTDPEDGYSLGVRVYRADAFKSGIILKALKDKDSNNNNYKKQSTFTGGTGLKSIQTPLIEATTEISSGATTFGDFCERLKPSTTSSVPDPNPQSKC